MRYLRRVQTASPATVAETLVLDYDARQRSRFLARLAGGEEVGVQLPRGTVLADGDCLVADDGALVRIVAAPEALSVARTPDAVLLARAAYHLGNRHVPLEVGAGRLAYRHDHVLDDLVRRLGLSLVFERGPFSPESGAYGHAGHHDHAGHHHHDHDQHPGEG